MHQQGFLEAAASHALQGGQTDLAYELAERSLYDALLTQGHQGPLLHWLAQQPMQQLAQHSRLMLAAAWSLALSDRHAQARPWLDRLLTLHEPDPALQCEAALIQGAAALYADDPDRYIALLSPWADHPPLAHPVLHQIHANRMAYWALLQAEPALARHRIAAGHPHDAANHHANFQANFQTNSDACDYARRWADLIVGISYLWEGQVRQVELLLTPQLQRAEQQLGRRHPYCCMLATLQAAAVWEHGRPGDAASLLAHRLDVQERHGLPELQLLAYRTLARVAQAEGAEHRALDWLTAMQALGQAQHKPRLQIASLTDQVRLHARRYRATTCAELCERLDRLLADVQQAGAANQAGPVWRAQVHTLQALAHGYAAIAASRWPDAQRWLQRAMQHAQAQKLGRLRVELLGLQALVASRLGHDAQALIREAADLAQTYGLLQGLTEHHPEPELWASALESAAVTAVAGQRMPPRAVACKSAAATPKAGPMPPASVVPHGLALTPKEHEVLSLLAAKLSNKEIGQALQVSEETVKWHLKNLFAKLDASSRRHVVQRARLLGVLVDPS